MRDRLRHLLRALLIGSVVGVLIWVAGGDNFVAGFVAGLFVEEFMHLSTWLQQGLIAFAARRGAEDGQVAQARRQAWEAEVDKYPGRITKLVAAMFIVLPTVAAAAADAVVAVARKPVGWVREHGRGRGRAFARRLVAVVLGLVPAAVALAVVGVVVLVVVRFAEGVVAQFRDAPGVLPHVSTLPFVVAGVSVLLLVVGGVRYVVSGGDQGSISSAKNAILYAVLGLTAAIFAFFVLEVVAMLG